MKQIIGKKAARGKAMISARLPETLIASLDRLPGTRTTKIEEALKAHIGKMGKCASK